MNGDFKERLRDFVEWWRCYCKGDEKGEAQIFLDRLFQAFGHKGILEAGGTLEFRIRAKKGVNFADLVWKPILLIEMKKRNTDLSKHYEQAWKYWIELIPDRPRYVVLCNFDEFWIYDFNYQLYEPMDKIKVDNLPEHWGALAFLLPEVKKPVFRNNLIEVTAGAAEKVADLFKSLIARGIEREVAQRFVLQCVLASFSEDIDLLPKYLFTTLVDECLRGKSSYDLLGDLFRRMNEPGETAYGRYKGVDYFNGGLFATVEPLELNTDELNLLYEASYKYDWSKIKPAIFGTIFEDSMNQNERHATGAHFTSENDIQKIVYPTIVVPWRNRIESATTIKELNNLLNEIWSFKVLDPACGSGNFLYIAYRELKRVEKSIIDKIREVRIRNKSKNREETGLSFLSAANFYGIDISNFAVELAKVTLMIAKKLAYDELHVHEDVLPLENLDDNIICADALFVDWPEVDAIIGNPPFQSKNKMQDEFGTEYLHKLRSSYSRIPGRADYCVYWFRKAHEVMKPNSRAGLVGTNSIRQNYSRIGGLDYITQNNGTIVEAVSNQLWSGDANVHVSIVNWIKGDFSGRKKLILKDKIIDDIGVITSSLMPGVDLNVTKTLKCNENSKGCYQGQTHGHEGFLLTPEQAIELIKEEKNLDVVFPYLGTKDLFVKKNRLPSRYVIDFQSKNVVEARAYSKPFSLIMQKVLPVRKKKAMLEQERNKKILDIDPDAKVNKHHNNFLRYWWRLSYAREELIEQISKIKRYIVCSQVTKRPIFEFISSRIRPNASLIVFPFEDDYSFGILQSSVHWSWFTAKCSTLREDYRYTSNTVFDTFPWPQTPSSENIIKVAKASRELRQVRDFLLKENNLNLRELYRTMELPGENPLKKAQQKLDYAVIETYGFTKKDYLEELLNLNLNIYQKEEEGQHVLGPGLPNITTISYNDVFSDDYLKME
ncbi:class I SAM-dependent DNA methyltransferase [Heliorestis acidaminivorans]|uniref:site-specific DNA-methyltransferase (adenine-specific) n=1 Tax=Heliorestis acidaminivorans TaxID=553427 RepID=A0A6I0F5Y0_9FIRM|nr:DNA methyltransferase [Heliorestis acidaminivorans]KAB2954237.1 class I SAM-dependent DNA methyltransferase [Heliorestis acidaminivorans]